MTYDDGISMSACLTNTHAYTLFEQKHVCLICLTLHTYILQYSFNLMKAMIANLHRLIS